jgi:hypothetical protein
MLFSWEEDVSRALGLGINMGEGWRGVPIAEVEFTVERAARG